MDLIAMYIDSLKNTCTQKSGVLLCTAGKQEYKKINLTLGDKLLLFDIRSVVWRRIKT
jgi:hypothetical protein